MCGARVVQMKMMMLNSCSDISPAKGRSMQSRAIRFIARVLIDFGYTGSHVSSEFARKEPKWTRES